MKIYETRYKAKKEANSDERIVKVDGGYIIMSPSEYSVWKNQK